jgi:hypothetical protein
MDGANEFAGGKIKNQVSRAEISVPNEHAAQRLGCEFVHVAVLEAEVCRVAKDFDDGELSGDAMEDGVRDAARNAERGGCGEATA